MRREKNTLVQSDSTHDALFANRILRDLNEGILVVDQTGCIKVCNQPARKMLDLKPDIVGTLYASIMQAGSEKNDAFHQLVLDGIYDKHHVQESTVDYYNKKEERRRLKVCTSFVLDDAGREKRGLTIIVSDVTQQEYMEQYRKKSMSIFALMILVLAVYLFIWRFLLWSVGELPTGIYTQIVQGIGVCVCIPLVKLVGFSFKSFHLSMENPKKTLFRAGVLSGISVFLLIVIKVIVQYVNPQAFPPGAPFWDWSIASVRHWIYPLTVVFQEFFIRCVMQNSLHIVFDGRRGSAIALIGTSLVFGILHIAHGFPFMVGATLLLGGLGVIYEKDGNLWGVAIVHMVVGYAAAFLRITE